MQYLYRDYLMWQYFLVPFKKGWLIIRRRTVTEIDPVKDKVTYKRKSQFYRKFIRYKDLEYFLLAAGMEEYEIDSLRLYD